MNDAIDRHPLETGVAYVLLDISSIVGVYALLHYGLHVDVPADFAIAFGISRLLRRVRTPVDVGVAALLARLYPALTQVQLTRVFARFSRSQAPPGSAPPGLLMSAVAAAGRIMDQYGLAFMGAQRLVGMVSVASIFALLRAGVDVQSLLDGFVAAMLPSGTGATGPSLGDALAVAQAATGDGTATAGSGANAAASAAVATPAAVLGAAEGAGGTVTAATAIGRVAGTWAASACVAATLFPGVVLGSAALGARLGAVRARLFPPSGAA